MCQRESNSELTKVLLFTKNNELKTSLTKLNRRLNNTVPFNYLTIYTQFQTCAELKQTNCIHSVDAKLIQPY